MRRLRVLCALVIFLIGVSAIFISCDDEEVAAHYNRGNAYQEEGKFNQAILAYKKAIEIDSDFAEAHYNLGNAYYRQGQIDEAAIAYRNAIRIQPDFVEARKQLRACLSYTREQ